MNNNKISSTDFRSGVAGVGSENSDVINQVRSTIHYNLFTNMTGNRNVVALHVGKLINSIQEHGALQIPILVNDQLQVIDGQHRLEAYRILEIPVPFMIVPGYGLDEIKVLNINQKNWGMLDYIRSWAEKGNPQYVDFLQYLEDYGYPINPTFAILANTGSTIGAELRENIRIGRFNIVAEQSSIDFQFNFLSDICDEVPWMKKKEKLMLSLIDIVKNVGVDADRLLRVVIENAEALQYKLDSYRTIKQSLQKMYNYRLPRNEKLRFWDDL